MRQEEFEDLTIKTMSIIENNIAGDRDYAEQFLRDGFDIDVLMADFVMAYYAKQTQYYDADLQETVRQIFKEFDKRVETLAIRAVNFPVVPEYIERRDD